MRIKLNGFEATIPTVIEFAPCQYMVFFIVYSPEGKRAFRLKKDINSLPKDKRKREAEILCRMYKEALDLGWDPRKDKFPNFRLLNQAEADPPRRWKFYEVLNFALEQKRKALSKFSMYDYEGNKRFIEKAAQETGFYNTDADLIERKDIRLILNTAVEQNDWTNNARNKCLTILRALLTVGEKHDMIKFNPAKKIDDLPVLPTEGFKRLTDSEREKVALHVLEASIEFYEYILFIYQDGIRRTELLQIELGDINIQERSLKIRADVAKTNDFRSVPLTDELLDIIIRREIWNYPKHYKLFSLKFKVGEKTIHPNTASNWWKKIVLDDPELNIDCKMYSLKHKGADDKIKAGIPLETLKTIYGHKSLMMTERYAKAVRKKYAEEIIEKAPAFGKVVKMKKAK